MHRNEGGKKFWFSIYVSPWKISFRPQEEIYRLEKGIESDQKLKHMAELQLSVVSDPASKHQIQVSFVVLTLFLTAWELKKPFL
jgi:hypothetical protein